MRKAGHALLDRKRQFGYAAFGAESFLPRETAVSIYAY